MLNLYLGHTRVQWAIEFAHRMNSADISKQDYKKCQRIFAWLANKIRSEERSDIETIRNNN